MTGRMDEACDETTRRGADYLKLWTMTKLISNYPPLTSVSPDTRRHQRSNIASIWLGLGAFALYHYLSVRFQGLPNGWTFIAVGVALQLVYLLRAFLRLRKHREPARMRLALWRLIELSSSFWLGPFMAHMNHTDPWAVVIYLSLFSLIILMRFTQEKTTAPYLLVLENDRLLFGSADKTQWQIKVADIATVCMETSATKRFLHDESPERITIHTHDANRYTIPSEAFSIYQVRQLLGLPPIPDVDETRATT
jgi:hypothetical protein